MLIIKPSMIENNAKPPPKVFVAHINKGIKGSTIEIFCSPKKPLSKTVYLSIYRYVSIPAFPLNALKKTVKNKNNDKRNKFLTNTEA